METPDRRQITESLFDPPAPAEVSSAELVSCWVVVCIHNRPDVTMPCLRTLHARTPIEVGLAIVDDASDEHTRKLLEEFAEQARADGRRCGGIRHDENVRYTRAINSGFEAAFGEGAEWAISLNSDTLVTDGWVQEMLAVGRPDDVGMVCPYMSDAALLTFPMVPGASYVEMAARLAHYARGKAVDAVTPVGACMAIRRALWEEVGPFDVERCPQGYGEECHFWALAVGPAAERARRFPGRKIREGSWRALLACGAYVYHLSHASYGRAANDLEKAAVKLFKEEHGNLLEARRQRSIAEDPRGPLEQKIRQVKADAGKPRLFFYLPHVELCGGMLALANIICGLTERGIDAALAYTWDKGLGQIPMSVGALKIGADPSTWVRSGGPAKAIVMATAWFTGKWVTQLSQQNAGIAAGCFVQDFESLFVKADGHLEYERGAPSEFVELVRGPRSVVNSNWVRARMKKELDADASEYIPIGVDPDLFYDRGLRTGGAKRIQILAMYRPDTPRRGDKLLREVYEKLHGKYGSRVDLATYGSNIVPGTVPVAQLGKIQQSELAAHMARTHILIEPSSVQGWGMPGQEAMASGACLVSTRNGGIANYGKHEENCLIADSGGLFDAVCRVIDDEYLRRSLGEHARVDMEKFSWSNVCDAWAECVHRWWAALSG